MTLPDAVPGSGFHRLRDASQIHPSLALVPEEPAPSEAVPLEAVPFEVTPNAVPGCCRTADGAAGLPAAKAVGLPAAERRTGIHPNEGRARVPALPGRPSAVHHPSSVRHPNSVHHPSFDRCCSPVTNWANAAVPGRHRPAKRRASAPMRWSVVCQSYSSPEQQCCHGIVAFFL